MADEFQVSTRFSRKQMRSASIGGDANGSMEQAIFALKTSCGTDGYGTPTARRNRPAARSQSARISATASGRSVSKDFPLSNIR